MSDGYPLRPLGEVMHLDIQRMPMTPATTYRLAGVLNAGQGLAAKGEFDGGDTEYAAMNAAHRPGRDAETDRVGRFHDPLLLGQDC